MFILLAVNETPEVLCSSIQAADFRALTHYIRARELTAVTSGPVNQQSISTIYHPPSINETQFFRKKWA
jgi:hypothetical protein